MKIKELIKNLPRKYLLMGTIGIAVLILAIILIIGFTKDGKITNSYLEGYKNYYSKKLKLSFDFPENYKVKKIDNIFYIAQKFNGKNAVKPYFTIKESNDFTTANQYLEHSTTESKKEYGNTFTPITEMLTTRIGDKFTSKIIYNNFYNDELIVENRYAFVLNGKVYVVNSYEQNTNSEEINDICKNIIASIEAKSQ